MAAFAPAGTMSNAHQASTPGRVDPRRRVRMGMALCGTLLASAWLAIADDGTTDVVPQVARRDESSGGAIVRWAAPVVRPADWPTPPHARAGAETEVDPLAWGAAQIAAAAASASSQVAEAKPFVGPQLPPQPPFAYVLIGRLDDGQPRALLTGPLRSFDVRIGEVLDDQWRIDDITQDGLRVTWLPGAKQLRVGFKAS